MKNVKLTLDYDAPGRSTMTDDDDGGDGATPPPVLTGVGEQDGRQPSAATAENPTGGNQETNHDDDDQLVTTIDASKILVGGDGGDFIAHTLSNANDVNAAIGRVQKLGAFRCNDDTAECVLGLLSALGVRRGEAYAETLRRAVDELVKRTPTLAQGSLWSLLDASFPYIGIEELKIVPLTVFKHMSPVPSSYLKQVSREMSIFRQLPTEVQRQCWALDAQLLRRHASPSIVAYGEELETTRANMDQDVTLTPLNMDDDWSPFEGGGAAKKTKKTQSGGPSSRIETRKASASVNRLKKIVGKNRKLYVEVIRLCRAQFENTGDDSVCSLRSQLLMALHDEGETDLCAADKCHRLAWLMDACIRDRYLDGRRLHEMGSILENAVGKMNAKPKGKAAKVPKPTRFRLVGLGAAAKKDGNESDDGGSISRVHGVQEKDDTQEQVTGDMGMILQDPPVLHLLLHETIRTLEAVIEAERVPKKEQRLHDLTRFICLGLTSQACLRENVNYIPATPKEIIDDFYPILGDLMLNAMLRESDDDMETGEDVDAVTDLTPDVREKLKGLLSWSPAARKITLTYALICLQRENIKTATEVLEVAAEVLIDTAIIHEGAFAVTLARRISTLLSEKKISTDSALWKHAVEDILVRATVASLEAHAAVLRLLLDAANSLSAESLASAVEATLVNTKKSRKQRKKRAKRIVYEYEPVSDVKHAKNGSTNNFGDAVNADGIDGSGPVSLDAIRSTYLLFTTREAKKLNETTAPILFDYVNKRAKRDKDIKDDDDGAGAEGYFDDEGDDGGSLMEFGLARDVKSPSVIRDSPLMSPR